MATINELSQTNKEVKDAVNDIVASHKFKLKSNDKKAKGQAVIIPLMKKEGIKSEKVCGLNFSYTGPANQSTFDKKKAKQLLLDQGFDSEIIELIWMECTKDGKKAECLKIS